MMKSELIYNLLLERAMKRERKTTQLEIARTLKISLSTVNNALQPLKQMGAVRINQRSLDIINAKKILFYWASKRNIEKDIIYQTRVEASVTEIEKNIPQNIIFTAYSAYRFMFKDAPADYSEIYIYSDTETLKEIKKRFPPNKNPQNLIVLRKQINELTTPNLFVDFWNIKEWYAKEYLKAMEEKINAILE
ncbi:MAG: winged helix-turn-helix transcriptional regulator [Nanoarchaeota archaeon]|nr:winged helix-turn-helix transcriptional regulator [Nanoarchaeota archaeon]